MATAVNTGITDAERLAATMMLAALLLAMGLGLA